MSDINMLKENYKVLRSLYFSTILISFIIFITSVSIAQTGIPNFEVDVTVGCTPFEITITNKSTAANIFYIYGDGTSGIDLKHTYNEPGIYDLIQVVSGPDAISLFDTIQVQVFNSIPVFLEAIICQDNEITLTFSPETDYTAYIIDYGDNTQDTIIGTNFVNHTYSEGNLTYNLTVSAGFQDNDQINLANCATLSTTLMPLTDIINPQLNNISILNDGRLNIDYTVSPVHRSILVINDNMIIDLDSSANNLFLSCQDVYNQINTFKIQTILSSVFTDLNGGVIFCTGSEILTSNTLKLEIVPNPTSILYADVQNENIVLNWVLPNFYPIENIVLFRNDTIINNSITLNTIQFIDNQTYPQNTIYSYKIGYLDKCSNDILFSNNACNILLTGAFTENNNIQLSWANIQKLPYSIIYNIYLLQNNSTLPQATFNNPQETVITFVDNNLDPTSSQFIYQVEVIIPDLNISFRSNILTLSRTVELKIPDAFTPNNDGINDIFRIISSNIKTIEFSIFNQWGNEIFKSNDKGEWDGNIQNAPAASGLYYYVVKIVAFDNQVIEKKGSMLLVR